MNRRVAIVSALAVATLAGAPLAAQAAPARPSAQVDQPYTHLVTGHTWSTGGTYISHGGDIKLKLTTLPKTTDVLVEDCESGGDLGDVQAFTKKAPSHVLATDVPAGTCVLILFQSHAKSGAYQVKGTLSY
ncbi:hypothetical protein F1D05_01770 [Kribbella qitaiheensis]|uniref:Uncharacterized protein n=1 Tax=Kribbella qitaiheensis TaxID=1544730 RepID=A0A7G6WS91_9ACTN|nr:hypothetical protein [Kribbella qitaiheensis]QNE16856.1 hypothetical protein F1D05_01770 [Kribbella qitaiheensis]